MAPVRHPNVPQPHQPAPVSPSQSTPAKKPVSEKTDAAKPADTFDRSLPIKSSGWSESDVKKQAQNLDANHDGKISASEVADFRSRARVAGMQDPRAATLFAKYEAGGAMAAEQGKVDGRQMSKAYLDGAFSRELSKLGTSAAEMRDIRKTIVRQSDTEVAADTLSELKAANGLTHQQDAAAKGVLDTLGMKDAIVIDSNGDGRIDHNDRVVSKSSSGKLASGTVPLADEINGALGINKVAESHAKHGKPEFMPNKPKEDWFPKKHWNYDSTSGNWQLNKGVSATEAIQYYRDHPTEFGGDCGAMKQLAAQSALSEQLGKKDYDALASKEGLSIGFSKDHNSAGLSKKIIKETGGWGDKPESYDAGTQGYAHVGVPGDAAATRALQSKNWAGEHFVVSTNDKGEKVVIAHPFGEMPARDFERQLRKRAADELAADGWSVTPDDIQLRIRPSQAYDVNKARELARQ